MPLQTRTFHTKNGPFTLVINNQYPSSVIGAGYQCNRWCNSLHPHRLCRAVQFSPTRSYSRDSRVIKNPRGICSKTRIYPDHHTFSPCTFPLGVLTLKILPAVDCGTSTMCQLTRPRSPTNGLWVQRRTKARVWKGCGLVVACLVGP